tara:strand:+ start:59 stop:490 length:432 start_codon:yes stop_codon:yes gene_type:complete
LEYSVVFVWKGAPEVWEKFVDIVERDLEVCFVVNMDSKVVDKLQKIVFELKEGRVAFQVETAEMADGGAEEFVRMDIVLQRPGYLAGIDQNAVDVGCWQMWVSTSATRRIFGAVSEGLAVVAGDAVGGMDEEHLVYQLVESVV